MIVILEGIDKVGKSTITQDLKSIYPNAVVFKLHNKAKSFSEYERNKLNIAYNELIHQALELSKERLVIFDRAYPSEMVYSVKRGYDAFYEDKLWDLDDMIQEEAMIFYCYVPLDVLVERFKQHNEKDLEEREFSQILERYEFFLSKTKVPIVMVDTTKSRDENKVMFQEIIQ